MILPVFRRILNRSSLILGFISIAIGVLSAETPSVKAVRDSLISNFEKIEDYSVKAKISVKMPGLRMPAKRIKLFYKHPDKIKVEADGFALIPKRGLGDSPEKLLSMLSSISVSGQSELNGQNHWLITGTVAPDSIDIPINEEEMPKIEMSLWVHGLNWVISQTEVMIDSQKVFQLVTDYETIEGINLPSKSTLSLGFKGLEDWSIRNPFDGPLADNRKYSADGDEFKNGKLRDEFAGTIIMEFYKYKVNSGLKDKLFKE